MSELGTVMETMDTITTPRIRMRLDQLLRDELGIMSQTLRDVEREEQEDYCGGDLLIVSSLKNSDRGKRIGSLLALMGRLGRLRSLRSLRRLSIGCTWGSRESRRAECMTRIFLNV